MLSNASARIFDVVVGLGSNVGQREQQLERAVSAIARLGAVLACSSVYETAPVGPPQPDFLNAAVRLHTTLEPHALLDHLLEIERAAGRERRERWGPRVLDLDVLWISGVVLATERLSVPHPELRRRAFALVPLLDVAPEALDPVTQQAYADMARALGTTGVRRVSFRLGDALGFP
ncbi:MAG: 2-amino-4-hydroxy-6-hydroxymethyldihydropteridine diphosphokinase [Pseudomonadota bacterium]|nr:MAG: 2-amino-4-hydroxy-6-hydroxymethyldihydropteridine diphosphokinase [Pseudomonadota bacterium]